jgi:hypothetical protein
MSAVSNLAAADQLAEEKLSVDGAGQPAELRRVGGRLFKDKEGVWTDAQHLDSLRVLTVQPYSPAYFALAKALPELTRYLSAGDKVLVAGKRVSIKVAPEGVTSLAAAEVTRTVKDFRGQ